MADDWPEPLIRQGIWTNCFPSRRASPVVLLDASRAIIASSKPVSINTLLNKKLRVCHSTK